MSARNGSNRLKANPRKQLFLSSCLPHLQGSAATVKVLCQEAEKRRHHGSLAKRQGSRKQVHEGIMQQRDIPNT